MARNDNGKRAGEHVALFLIALSGSCLLMSVSVLVLGAVYQLEAGLFSAFLSDQMALLWITLASTMHLILVPAICVFIALRDTRRKRAGIEIPSPRSVWSGHESVFASPGSAHR